MIILIWVVMLVAYIVAGGGWPGVAAVWVVAIIGLAILATSDKK